MGIFEGLPPRTHPSWNAVTTGQIKRQWNSLAVKIMMSRIAQEIAKDSSPANVQRHGDELYTFFKKNEIVAAKDIASIFG